MVDNKQLSILNPEPRHLPGPELLHLLVSGADKAGDGDRNPQTPALDYRAPDGTQVTLPYPEMHRIASILATEIDRRLHIVSGSAPASPPKELVVPVLIPQAPELYVSLLGILKAGGAFCPIQLDAPPDRIRFILGDVGADVVLTTSAMVAKIPTDLVETLQVVLVDEMHLFDGSSEQLPPSFVPRTVGPDDLAYVMYTSGSTGTPKGVGVPHGAATQSLLAHNRHVPQFRRFLQFAAPTFDVSVFEIFFPWFRGATLVCCSRAEMLDDLPSVISSLNVDACELTPTVAGSLLQTRANAPDLKLLLTIGEMLTEPVIREFGHGPEQESILWAMYGPTEAAIHCTLQPALDGAASVKNIGFPLDTVSAYILAIPDEEAGENSETSASDPRIVPLGEVGELAVGGYQLARGYINRPEQTAAAFINTEKYGRLYRTGDKACITEHGILECSGRLSGGQVKLRGQRIELGEIEQAILRTSGCLGSVAAVINGILVAFCDIGSKGFADAVSNGIEEAILKSCQSWLPRFMIPGDVVLMADFPRLASGKVDRKRLSSDYTESTAQQTTSASQLADFRDDFDRQLHDIAYKILGTTIDNKTTLAAAGLDSLKAIRFAAAIRASLKMQVSAVDVLEARSLSTLHARLQKIAADVTGESQSSRSDYILDASVVLEESPLNGLLSPQDVELMTECGPMQIAMLAETLADPRAYCNWIELEFANNHTPDAIVSAFEKLIAHNEALRTGFVQHDGRFVLVVRRTCSELQIQKVEQLQHQFQLETEASLLVPFHVQIEDKIPYNEPTRAVLHIHHAVYDGWSADLMRRDLDALLKGESLEKRQPYSSVVQHYHTISAKDKGAAEQFWAESFNAFQPTAVPELNPRRHMTCNVVTKLTPLSIAKDQVDRAAGLVGCSTQVIFQAALAWLWSGLVGSPDVVLGTVTSGRTIPLHGIETVIGPCLQTVPLRTDLSRMQTIRDLLQALHASNRHLLPHAFLPLSEIKKTAGIQPGQPFYNVLFVFQESLFSHVRPDDAVKEVAHQDYLETKLLWEVEPVNSSDSNSMGQFRLRTTFYADTFPESQVELLLDQFTAVVRHIVDHIDDAIATVHTSIPESLQSCHNLDYHTFKGCPDLASLVRETAKRTPDRPAVCFATSLQDDADSGDGTMKCTTITFNELDRLANQVARCLRASLGVKTGDAVAIIMDKSSLLYAGILGILKSGCAYLPLLPSTPLARMQTILEQAGVRSVLSDTAASQNLISIHGEWTVLDLQAVDLASISDGELKGDEAIPVDPSRIANIVYTSGSTGVPKGVCVTQLNICSNLDVLSRLYPIPSENGGRMLQSCSQAFDVSVFEIFFSWVYGLCVCSATNNVLFADLERAIRLFGVTHLSMTPTVAALVNPEKTPSVEFLVTAGEPLTERVAIAWSKQLFQGYGPSETTNICTVKKMALGDTIRHLGFAFENTSTVVLPLSGDGSDSVPLGAVGEFCFGGDQVAAGYLGLPTLTAEKFIQHPVYGRLYRSGDVGRMLPDGSLMITGRIDDQIKLRGQRIELNEINFALCASPLIKEALTLVIRQKGSEQLASFFVPTSSALSHGPPFHVLDVNQELLRSLFSELQSRLPVYMVSTFLVPIAAVPLTPSGKVNKALLLETFQNFSQDQLAAVTNGVNNSGDDAEEAAQWTDLERQICDAVASVLKADSRTIGRWTPLASLGLDSLSAILVARRLSTAESRLVISDVLRNASVAQLARHITEKATHTSYKSVASPTLDVFSSDFILQLQKSLADHDLSSTKPALPCMPLQEAMLVSLTPGKSYVNHMLFRLACDAITMQDAWKAMCARHDILRTCFVTTDHSHYPIAQVVLDDYAAPWLEMTTSTEESVGNLVKRHAHTLLEPVDSFQPPVSFAIIKDGEENHLSFVCHHAVYDGEAMGRLLWEVEQLVIASHKEISASLEPAPQFGPFLGQALHLPRSTDAFWSKHLSGFRPALFRPAIANDTNADVTSGLMSRPLDIPVTAIQDQVQTLGVSLLTAFQATWACVTRILLETDDICFGNVYSGRFVLVEDVDCLVAPCFNTLPIRANLSALRSYRDLLSYFQALNPDLILHQFTPLRQIQRQHSSGRRLFDSLLLLQPPSKPLDASIWALEQDDGEMDLPIVCELMPDQSQDSIEIRLHFDRQYLTSEGAALLLDLFSSLLRTLVQFSSSHVPGRADLPSQLQDRLRELQIEVEHVKNIEEIVTNGDINGAGPDETWNATESIIRSVLCQLSSVPEDNIRRDTTIYRLGLDSVRAVQVASALRKQGLQVSAVDVMEHPSCMGLADFLSPTPTPTMAAAANTASIISELPTPATTLAHTPLSSPPSVSLPALRGQKTPKVTELFDFGKFQAAAQSVLDKHLFYADSVVEAILPCTPLQSGLLTEFKRSNGSHYFNFISFQRQNEPRFGNLDGQAWERAWRQASASIPMLRTGFISMDDAVDAGDDNEAESALSPFAMIQVSSTIVQQSSPRITFVKDAAYNLDKWKIDVTKQALTELHLPPWQVVIVEDGQDVNCHLAIHHALYDAASLRSILDEVVDSTKQHADAPEPVSQTGAVVSDILHQVSWLTCDTSSLVSLWKEKASQTVVNTFPILTPLKEAPGQFRVLSRQSSQSLSALQSLVQQAGFTLHAVLQAAWARILSSYLGDASVVFGVVLSGRNTDATENAVFPCISTLPVVAQNKASNRELVEQMMDTSILLHKSQHVPLRQIQRWLGQPDARLFDTLLVYQSAESGPSADYYPWTVVDEQAIVDYPISIEAITTSLDKPLDYQITYDTGVLPTEHAAVLLEQLDGIVGHLASCPDGSEHDLVSLHPNIYSVLPPSVFELPSEVKLLHEFVERQAELRPSKTALQFVTSFDERSGGVPIAKECSFRELNTRGNQVARLVSQHAEPGSIVAICFDKCPEAFFAMLGILKAGCAYLALDPGAPSARKDFILQDSGAKLLLTDTTRAKEPVARNGLSDISAGVEVVFIDESSLRESSTSLHDSNHAFSERRHTTVPSDVCYCLYTSGTTGTPKGCAITHENAVQCMLAFQELFRNHYDADTSRWLQFASFHFDVAVLEQYWTWSVGMTLVSAPRDLILEDLAGTISRLEITHIDLTPSLGRLLDPNDVPSLCRGVFITGGEPLKQEMLDPWGPTGAVHNFYGPTEATIGVTSYPQVPQNGRASNIGRQFPNVGTLVFQPGTQTPVLRGGVGELCVSGKLVGQGYLNRAELTNERFPELADTESLSYRKVHGDRIYRTGDLVRMMYDGCFDFLGRADDQVKLRGQRLEIGEINHAIRLGLGAAIGDVATLVIRDEDNKKDFLVSFVVVGKENKNGSAVGDQTLVAQKVQAACRERLPGYMVPTYVVQLASIPLSPNNKAESKELKRIFNSLTPDERMCTTGASSSIAGSAAISTTTAATTSTTPSLSGTPTGQTVIQVLHKLSLLSPNDNSFSTQTSIFELGIDSVSVLRFARALKRAGLPLATPSLVLAHPNMGDLVAALADGGKKEGDARQQQISIGSVLEARLLVDACQHRTRTQVCEILGVGSDEVEYIAPCSALQQGIISRTRSSGPEHSDTYFNAFHLQLNSATNIEKLHDAWKTVQANSAILRTRFVLTREGYVQAALKTSSSPLPWTHLDLEDNQNCDYPLQEHYMEWVDDNLRRHAIDKPWQLLSVTWRGTNTLVLHIFHGLYDATSLDLILGEVAGAYDQNDNSPPSLSDKPSFLEALVHGPLRNYGNSRGFWENHLKDRGAMQPVPSLFEPGTRPDYQDIGVSRVVNFATLEKTRVQLGVTHAALVQALWVSVLQRAVFGADNGVSLGLVLSGRTMEDFDHAEGIVGPLFNTLPFFVPASTSSKPAQTWASLAQACNSFGIMTLPFQQVPLRDIQKWCSSGQPLFDVLFSFQFGNDEDASKKSTQSLWTQAELAVDADYPLALEAVLRGLDSSPSLRLFMVAKGDIADEKALNKLLDQFESALQAMSADPFSPIIKGDRIDARLAAVASSEEPTNAESTPSNQSQDKTPFEWSDTSLNVRKTIAAVASVPEESVTENTTLLELGLDSVDTIKLSARLRDAGIRLTNGQLVRGQTIASFMSVLDTINIDGDGKAVGDGALADKYKADVAATSAALRKYLEQSGRDLTNITHILPPTPLQEAMVADMIQSEFQLYFNHDILELAPTTDLARLKAAWVAIVTKHAILRTVFFSIDTPDLDMAYCQAVHKTVDCISEHTAPTKGSLETMADGARNLAIPDQGESHLLHLSFVHTQDDNRQYLILSLSHALYDGWSLDLLHRAVESEYQNPTGAPMSIDDQEPTYTNQLARILQSTGHETDRFWQGFLDGAQATLVHRADPAARNLTSDKKVARLDSTSSVSATELRAFCKRQAVSVQVVGQACWASVLSTLTGSLDLLFGVVLSGRDDVEGDEAALFPTMNTVPVRVVLHGTISELLQYMQVNMGTIGEHQHIPLRKAQRFVSRAGNDEPGIFNTLFILQKRLQQETNDKSTPLMTSVGGASDAEYPICVEMEVVQSNGPDSDTVVWRTACDQAYASEAAAARLLEQLDSVLRFMIQAPVHDSMLAFSDNGVSVCGLAPFLPKMTTDTNKQDSQKMLGDEGNEESLWTDDELAIRSVLSAVSGVPKNAIQRTGQTLYHLGLDSISTIKVSTLLKKTKGISLGVRAMLSASSVQEMAAIAAVKKQEQQIVRDQVNSQSELSSVLVRARADDVIRAAGISPADVEQVLPATAMQVHMVSVWQNTEGNVFFPAFHYRLATDGELGLHTVHSAWAQLVADHPILRTVFLATNPDATVPLLQVVLRGNPLSETNAIWPSLGDNSSHSSLANLSVLSETNENGKVSFQVTLRIHHALYDAVSLQTLLGRFEVLLQSTSTDTSKLLSSAWEKVLSRQISPSTTQKNKQLWSQYFAGANIAKSEENDNRNCDRASFYRPAASDNIQQLKETAVKLGVGLQSLVFAVYVKTLSSRSGNESDVVFGVYLANRDQSSGDENDNGLAAYPTLCLVPLLVRSPAQRSLADIAAQIQADIHALSTSSLPSIPAPITASLWEIQQWTGVTVDSFVNFLLPDDASTTGASKTSSKITLEHIDGPLQNEVDNPPVLMPSAFQALQGNRVRDAYKDAIDVEIAVRNNALDIGIFGSSARLGDDDGAKTRVEELVAALQNEVS
ncbi:NRPS [Sporothrix bragantina]|uniref:NRPS n=1 Tax=Sporothrix bragantina TaxID=671064 RepID=A0ABP0CIY3_9PEZI